MARKQQRRQALRPIIPTLIGAGITERYYFQHLKDLKEINIKIKPRFFGTEKVFELDNKIDEVLNSDGQVIVVFDTDVMQWNDIEQSRLKALREKYSDNANVLLCESMPSIEYWFLLHYENTNRHFPTSKDVIAELRKHIKQFDKSKHFLENRKWVEDLNSKGKLPEACKRAKTFARNGQSYTDIWKIFDH